MAENTYQINEIIFQKGDPSEFAYVIQSGQVEILQNFPAHPTRIALLGQGNIFGEMGLIDERPRSLTARAVTETKLSTVTRDEFIGLLRNRPDEAFRYLRTLFERLRAMNLRVAIKAENEILSQTPQPKDFFVTLVALTPLTNQALRGQSRTIIEFPFRVGRNSTREEDPLDVNDLQLFDSPPFNVSRNHFAIEKQSDGILIHDRGSYLGTIVNGKPIGGHHHEALMKLENGENEIIVGTLNSPFRFKVIVEERV
jgi:hypothetical protein